MIRLTRAVFNSIIKTIGARMPESGGILAINKSGIIDDFAFDNGIESSANFYVPDTRYLNEVICAWEKSGARSFTGMIHSHDLGKEALSESDVEYVSKLLDSFELKYLFMFLMTTDTKTHKLLCYKCHYNQDKKVIVKEINIKIIR